MILCQWQYYPSGRTGVGLMSTGMAAASPACWNRKLKPSLTCDLGGIAAQGFSSRTYEVGTIISKDGPFWDM